MENVRRKRQSTLLIAEMKRKNIIADLYKHKIHRIDGKHLEDCEYLALRRELTLARMKVEV